MKQRHLRAHTCGADKAHTHSSFMWCNTVVVCTAVSNKKTGAKLHCTSPLEKIRCAASETRMMQGVHEAPAYYSTVINTHTLYEVLV